VTPVADAPPGEAGVAYEELRSHVLTGGDGNGVGLILLLREGLAAWLEGQGTRRHESEVRPSFRTYAAAPVPSGPIHASIVRVLASLVLAG
jgi:hypothetical protein